MQYILINPVVDLMYEREKLDYVLKMNGYHRVECNTSWGPIVKKKYQEMIQSYDGTVIDARCPVAAQKIGDMQEEGFCVATIDPILLHCGRELSERSDLKEYGKVVTTPCQALADAGNQLGLRNTIFISWNEFEKTLDGTLMSNKLESSPIPPGFFADVKVSNHSISGKDEIESYFHTGQWKQTKIVEVLYCQQGCHNGDGVLK